VRALELLLQNPPFSVASGSLGELHSAAREAFGKVIAFIKPSSSGSASNEES
jgi:hypothetical protein